ncbi:MAG: ABC transporter permease [Bryobacteraceae bacterium]|nr:ABC transporter permease [Bryobacteraceae bacterium]
MDLRFAIRGLAKNRGYAALATGVLALGIGANTAVFTVVNAVLLQPLEYRDSERIVAVSSRNKTTGRTYAVSGPDYHDWRRQSTVFEAVAYWTGGAESIRVGSVAEQVNAAAVTEDFFRVFSAAPRAGALPGAKAGVPEAVISETFRRRHFSSDAEAVGQTLYALQQPFRIAGVLPEGFHYPSKTEVWVPASVFPETPSRSAHNYRVVAKLKQGASVEQAQAQMMAIAQRLEEQYPGDNRNKSAAVSLLRDQLVRDARPTLYLLMGAVGLILLIACANVGNLTLARASVRTREMAIRAALGASRQRVIRQLLVESALLAAIGGAAGLLMGQWCVTALVALAPADLPRLSEIRLDGWVLLFTTAASALSIAVFGLLPAWQASRVDLNEALKQTQGRGLAAGAGGRLRSVLVVAELAFAVMLVAGAALLLRSFANLSAAELGFRPERLLVAKADVPAASLEGAQRAIRFYDELLEQARAMPGALKVAAAFGLAGSGRASNGSLMIEGRPRTSIADMPQAGFRVVSPGYFETAGIPLRAGRDFEQGDRYDGPGVAIINEALARTAFAGQNPLGRRLECGLDRERFPMTIVGVVADVRENGPASAPGPEVYMPCQQHPRPATAMFVLVRTAGDPMRLAEPLRQAVRRLSVEVPVEFTTAETILTEAVATPRFRTVLLATLAGLALVLAGAGVYGVMAYQVARRSPEIGLRMALGAEPGSVLRMVLGGAVRLAAIGGVLGCGAALVLSRFLEALLFEVSATEPVVYCGAAAVLAAVAAAGALLPSYRAARVDPLVALRQE